MPSLDRSLLGRITSLATPVVLGMLSTTIMGLIDLIMVGRLGAAELAAVGLATNILYAAVRTTVSLGTGVQTVVARRVGESRHLETGEVVRVAQCFGLLVGLPLTVIIMLASRPIMGVFAGQAELADLGASYMFHRAPETLFLLFLFVHRGFFQGIGRTGVPLAAGVLMLVLNIFLNWMWIFGHLGFEAMGVKGAGLASATSALVGMLALALLTRSGGLRENYDLQMGWSLNRDVLSRLWRISWPDGLRVFLVIMAFSVFLAILERIGTLELAASNGVVRITSFSFMPAFGIGTAAGVLVGQALGKGDVALARRVGWYSVGVSSLFMGIMGVLFLTIPQVFVRIFTSDPEILAVGVPLQRLMGVVQVFDAVGLCLAGAIAGAGHTRFVMLADVGTGYLIFLPSAFILGVVLGFGAVGAWTGLLLWFFCFAGVMVWQWMRGGWAQIEV